MAKRTNDVDVAAMFEQGLACPEKTFWLARNVLRIRDKNGCVRPLEPNRAQQAFEQRRARRNIVLKARQMGITTWVAGRFFLKTAFVPGTCSMLVAHQREAAETIFGMVRRMWEELPEELRLGSMRLRRANAGEIVFAHGSEFRIASAADLNAGRGLSVRNLHCSEVSRWPGDARATLAGLQAALVPEGELVVESTPTGAYGAFFEMWRESADAVEADQEGDVCVRHFFPWWMEPSYTGAGIAREGMREDELLLASRHGLSAEQIGFRRSLEKRFGPLRTQEFAEDAETCFRATGACVFETNPIERRMTELPGAIASQRNGALLQWLPAVRGREYIVAVDTAGGGGDGDFAAVQVVDAGTGMQCAELQERLRPGGLAGLCRELAREYNGALIAVERNNHGAAVLALLEQDGDATLYRQHGQAGWLTTSANRPQAIAQLGSLLQTTPELFMSRRLLGECRTFISDGSGRAAAAQGAHDDLVMSMAIAQAVRRETMSRAARAA